MTHLCGIYFRLIPDLDARRRFWHTTCTHQEPLNISFTSPKTNAILQKGYLLNPGPSGGKEAGLGLLPEGTNESGFPGACMGTAKAGSAYTIRTNERTLSL